MMSPCNGNKRSQQRGDMLLEALIGIVLLGLLGMGLSYAVARIVVQQRYANTQDLALGQMRHILETQGMQALCGGFVKALQLESPSASFSITPTVQCTSTAVMVTVPASGQLPAIAAPIDSVVTEMRYATPEGNAQASQLLGSGSLVIRQ